MDEQVWLARIRRRDAFAFRIECVLFGMQAALVRMMIAAPHGFGLPFAAAFTFVLVRDARNRSWGVPA
jgi:hypothetical protein